MNKNLLATLIFLLVLVVCFWVMPDLKVQTIGDFFAKIIRPVAIPLSLVIGGKLGFLKYREWKIKKE